MEKKLSKIKYGKKSFQRWSVAKKAFKDKVWKKAFKDKVWQKKLSKIKYCKKSFKDEVWQNYVKLISGDQRPASAAEENLKWALCWIAMLSSLLSPISNIKILPKCNLQSLSVVSNILQHCPLDILGTKMFWRRLREF